LIGFGLDGRIGGGLLLDGFLKFGEIDEALEEVLMIQFWRVNF
jgi:hypothetical protein